MSQVCAPSTSPQTLTQRWQRTQRLWSFTKRSCEASTGSFGWRYGTVRCVTPRSWARFCSSQWPFETQTAQTWFRSEKRSSTIVLR